MSVREQSETLRNCLLQPIAMARDEDCGALFAVNRDSAWSQAAIRNHHRDLKDLLASDYWNGLACRRSLYGGLDEGSLRSYSHPAHRRCFL